MACIEALLPASLPVLRFRKALPLLACGLFLAVASFLLVGRSLQRDLNHDEHQFLAPAFLIAREGLQPYRDFPIFHLPNLAYAYAALAWAGLPVLTGAKLLQASASAGTLLCLFALARQRQEDHGASWWLRACFAGTLLLLDPLFLFTAGKTWNHELPAFLLLLAMVFHVETWRRLPQGGPLLAGLFAALATGTRLTYLIPAAAFPLHYLLQREEKTPWLRRCLFFSGGFTLGMAPTLICFASAPDAFWFDNFRFPKLRLLDPENLRIQQTMRWSRKLRFFGKEVLPRSWPLVLGCGGVVFLAARRAHGRWSQLSRHEQIFLLLLPLSLVGCFLPARYQYQHLFVLPVLLAAGIVIAGTSLPETSRAKRILPMIGLCLLLAALFGWGPAPVGERYRRKAGWHAYQRPKEAPHKGDQFAVRFRRQHGAILKYVPSGTQILTLAPTDVQVIGCRIYPELASGVFGWRAAGLLAPTRREELRFLVGEDLEKHFAASLPVAILTGVEDPVQEAPLIAFARRHGYAPQKIYRSELLWLPPAGAGESPRSSTPPAASLP